MPHAVSIHRRILQKKSNEILMLSGLISRGKKGPQKNKNGTGPFAPRRFSRKGKKMTSLVCVNVGSVRAAQVRRFLDAGNGAVRGCCEVNGYSAALHQKGKENELFY